VTDRFRRLLPGLVVSGAFTVVFLARADWAGVARAIEGVDVRWVVLVALALFLEHVVRAIRWRVLLRDLVPEATTFRLWVATAIGMSINAVIPFRLGDLVRPWLVAREHDRSYVALLTIAVIERVFDILGLMGQVLLLGLLAPPDADGVVLSRLRWATLFGAAGLVALATFMVMAANEARTRAIYERLVGFFPAPVRARFLQLYGGFAEGLGSVRRRSALVAAAAWSLLHWTNGSLAIWLLCRAFHIDLPMVAACFTNVVLAVSVGLPQAPGYLGVFHTAIETALRAWDIDAGFAQAFAMVFWFVSFVPITLTGLVLLAREGLSLADLRRDLGRAEARPATPGGGA
jgi:glycosyltransferase 2 family protein